MSDWLDPPESAARAESNVTKAARAILRARGLSDHSIEFDEKHNLPTWQEAVRDAAAALTAGDRDKP